MAKVTEKSAIYTAPPEDVTQSRTPMSGMVAGLIATSC